MECMVRFGYYFYVTEILVTLKDGKLGKLDLNEALKSRKLPFLSDFDWKIPYRGVQNLSKLLRSKIHWKIFKFWKILALSAE